MYALCKEFGWTPSELRVQDNDVVDAFITILNARNEEMDRESRRRRT